LIYRFGAHAVDAGSLALTKDGAEVAVEPQVFSLLQLLIENRDRVVPKDEIIEAVWDGRIVSDGTLNTRINSVRRAVGDDGKAQAVIKTFARRGFRFVADLADEADIAAELALPGGGTDKPTIAVLPFDNLSGDPEQEYFSDGLADDVISALSRIRQLNLVSRNSSFAYRGAATDTRDVARELGAGYVLEGSVRKAGNRVRISVQLIDGASGNQIWSERYDRDLEDIFAVQDEITEAVVGAVEPELTKSEIARARAKRPDSLNAWELCLQGRYHNYLRTEEDIGKAIRLLEQAIELDPDFSAAYQVLSHAKLLSVVIGISEHEEAVGQELVELANHALRLDRDDDSARMALARALNFTGRHVEADLVIQEALKLNPTSAFSQNLAGRILIRLGRGEDGLRHSEEAMRLSPRDTWISPFMVTMAEAHLQLENYELAIEWADRALREANATWIPAALKTLACRKLDRIGDAEQAAADLIARFPSVTLAYIDKRWSKFVLGMTKELVETLREAGMAET
jgi:TolB-like protein